MLRRARYCHGKLYVRLFVWLEVWLETRHIGWDSWKIISRLISVTFPLSADPNMTDLLQKEHPNFSWNQSGVGKIVDFRHLSRRISETVQDRVQVVRFSSMTRHRLWRCVFWNCCTGTWAPFNPETVRLMIGKLYRCMCLNYEWQKTVEWLRWIS